LNKLHVIALQSLVFIVLAALAFVTVNTFVQNDPFLNLRTIKHAVFSISLILGLFAGLEYKWQRGFWIMLLIPVVVVITGKGLALLAVSVFVLASLGMGLWLYPILNGKQKADEAACPAYAFFLGLGLNGMLIWVAMHFRINFMPVYYGFCILEVFLFHKQLLSLKKQMVSLWQTPSAGQKLLVIAGLFYCFYALVPYYLYDDILCHLYVPKFVKLNGFWNFHPSFSNALDLAIIPRSAYTALFLMGGEYAVRIFNVLVFFVGFASLEQFIRLRFNTRTALFALLLAVTTPYILWEMGVVFLDSFQFFSAVILFMFLFKVLDQLTPRMLVFYFVLCAVAYVYKQHAVMLIIPTGLILTATVLWKTLKEKKLTLFWPLVYGAGVFLAIVSIFLLHNYMISGNPMFPYYNGIFKSEWFWPSNFADVRWQHPMDWKFLYDITFRGAQYCENINYTFGISFFMFFPLIPYIFLNRKWRKEIGLSLFVFGVGTILWVVLLNPYLRYFSTCLPIGVLLLGLTLDKLLHWMKTSKVTFYALYTIFGMVLLTNLAIQWSVVHVTAPYPLKPALTRDYSDTNMGFHQEIQELFKYTKEKYGVKARALFVTEKPLLYFNECHGETLEWYHYKAYITMLEKPQTAEALFQAVFVDNKMDFIVMSLSEVERFKKYYTPEFMEKLNNEFSIAEHGVFSPKAAMDSGRKSGQTE
jgi:Dolichyl-phosphate-mannose-protein mannosyltransferase